MSDVAWIGVAVVVGLSGIYANRVIRDCFGRRRFGRFVADVVAVCAYFLALDVALIQTNGGWHLARDGFEVRSTWAIQGPITFVLAIVIGAGVSDYFEKEGIDGFWGRRENPFPSWYVKDVVEGETSSTAAQCRRMARRLWKISQRSGQPLPAPLAEFVDRHLDRTA